RVAALIHVPELHRAADANLTAVGRFLAGNHAEQRGLADAVGADHAHDAARRQAERKVVDQQLIAVSLAQILGFDHQVAEVLALGNLDFDFLLAALLLFGRHLFVSLDASLALGLASPRSHPNPLEFLGEGLLASASGLLFLFEPLLFLLQPR